MPDLLNELLRVAGQGLPCVNCTVVASRGPTPQKPGAAMLVYADGTQAGTIGGGCVEAEVRRRALATLAGGAGKPEIHSFHLDNDFGWDDGLICGGHLTVLAAPVTPAAVSYFQTLHDLIEAGAGHTEVVALPENSLGRPAGDRWLFDPAARLAAKLADGQTAEIEALLPPLADRPLPRVHEGVAILPTLPRVRLLIVGGGHVGQAVARLAAEVDFEVWVLDDRESVVSIERFPQAQRRIAGDIGRTLKELKPEITPATFCLIVTRGHNHDEEALYHLAPTPAGYVGMIGSKRKVRLIFDDLRAKEISEDALARVHAPVGLEIGSQTVAEIAVSIVAQLVSVRNLGANATGNPQKASVEA